MLIHLHLCIVFIFVQVFTRCIFHFIHICMCTYIYMCIFVNKYISTCQDLFIITLLCLHIYAYIYIFIYTHEPESIIVFVLTLQRCLHSHLFPIRIDSCVCSHVCVCGFLCVYMYLYGSIYVYTYTHADQHKRRSEPTLAWLTNSRLAAGSHVGG